MRQSSAWNYASDWQEETVPWQASTPRRTQPSPRRAAKSPRQPKRKAGKRQVLAQEPEWPSQITANPSSAPSASASTVSLEAQQLRELVSTLKKSDLELTPEIQAAMSKVKVITPKEASKLMHGAVSRLDTAREKLQKAKTARTNMHRNSGKFLDDSVKRWQQHGEKFTKEDEELANAIDAATSVFQAARTHLEETKEALAEFDNIVEKEIPEVSDEDLMADTTGSIGDGIQEMLTNLTRLRDAQDDIEANAAKKARTEEPPATPAAEGGSALPKAMQPFGGGANRPVGDLPGPLCSGCGRCPIHCCLLEPLHFGG